MKKILFAVLTAGLFAACTQEAESGFETQEVNDGINATVTVKAFTPSNSTRTVVDEDGSVWWKTGDRMGMFAHNISVDDNSTREQTALTLGGVLDTHSAAFTGGIGWQMLMDGKHKYFAYYPYNVNNTHDEIVLEYPTKYIFSSNDSREHLGQYDYMYSKVVSPINKERAAFEFEHINALAKFSLEIPEGYRDRKFTKMTIAADDSIFTETATYSVSSIVAKGEPEVTQTSKTNMIEFEFSGDGVSVTDGTLTTWLMMFPAQCNGKEFIVRLYCGGSTIPLLEGKFTPTANQQASMIYSYNVAMNKHELLPDKPKEGEQLHILLFGHSFGVDCTEYLPAITKAAGINNVHYGRFYYANCSLEEHYKYLTKKTQYSYQNCPANSTSWTSIDRYIEDVIKETPWDIVIFQQNLEYSGIYSKYQPYLNSLISYVKTTCEQTHNKVPIIGWNMFWPISRLAESGGSSTLTYRLSFYNNSSEQMYQAYCSATQEMMNDTGIELVIPSGTTIQNLRTTSLNTTTEYEFTRDMYHMSYGIGRYAGACTWFQTLMAPIYNIDIEGNLYRPTESSNADDKVTDAKTATIWQCVKAALAHPFEVTTIDE